MAKVGWVGGDGTTRVVSLPRPAGAHTADGPTHPCASCGVCCRTYVVPLCGRDVWRISREMHLEPARFVVAWREQEPGDDTFRLEPEGPLYSLVLDKRGWASGGTACVFLLNLAGGQARCGIYEHRPAACRAYPMVPKGASVALRDDPLCPPGAWGRDEPARPGWGMALRAARMDFDVYRLVIRHWNAQLENGAPRSFDEYYRYVLRGYDALDGLVGPEEAARLRDGWRGPTAAAGAPAWQAHLDRVRGVLSAL